MIIKAQNYEVSMRVRNYCMELNLFTAGSSEQWNKMCELRDTEQIAVAIWVCSSTELDLETIMEDVHRMFNDMRA